VEPTPQEAKESAPGARFAAATSPAKSLISGRAGPATTAKGTVVTSDTGAKSRTGS
jgi:hypothetical protein